MFTHRNSHDGLWNSAVTLFNMVERPQAYFKNEVMRILDEQYDHVLRYWPQQVRFADDPQKPYTTDYIQDFPAKPAAYPENLEGFRVNSTSSFSFTPVKKKWLTQEFLSAVDRKVENLKRACAFPECTLRLNGFDMLKDIAADASRAADEKMAIDMHVNIDIQGPPAPQQ